MGVWHPRGGGAAHDHGLNHLINNWAAGPPTSRAEVTGYSRCGRRRCHPADTTRAETRGIVIQPMSAAHLQLTVALVIWRPAMLALLNALQIVIQQARHPP